VRSGPSDGRVTTQHELQTHLGNPDWVKGYQGQPHQPGPLPQEGAPTHYETTHPNGFVDKRYPWLMDKLLTTGDPRGKQQFHRDDQGLVHAYDENGSHQVWTPRTASGLGMPQDGMAGGADVAGSVTDVNVPQTPVMVSPGGAPGAMTDPNQVTTKPRQEPGGSGGGAPADPAIGQSPDGGPDDSGSSDGPPSKEARRARAARILAMMTTAQQENPSLSKREAYVLASTAMERYPIVIKADWDGINYGNRGNVPDGPATAWVRKLPQTLKKKQDGLAKGPGGDVAEGAEEGAAAEGVGADVAGAAAKAGEVAKFLPIALTL
jgi:hypothetical protein